MFRGYHSERPTNVNGKPRLLFLSHRLPFPPHNGAAVRTFNLLRMLAVDFDIHGLCFERPDPAFAADSLEARLDGLAGLGVFEAFPIPQATSRLRYLWDHVRSVLRGRPYTWYIHDCGSFRRRLRGLVNSGQFDMVHVDSLDLAALLPDVLALPVALTHHNVESSLLARRADSETTVWRSAYLHLQSGLLRRAERRWLPRVSVNIAVSETDAGEFTALVPDARVEVIPNGVDVEYFTPKVGESSGCVFVGGTSWYPNLDGLKWFAQDILPKIHAFGSKISVMWVGRATPSELLQYNKLAGLNLTGYVEDIRPFVQSAACFIAPLRVGGGTRLKLLDAWAMGKAVVSTSRGAEGLATVDGENILLADSADDFALAVLRVLEDQDLRATLEREARKTAETHYSWDVVGGRLRDLYHTLCGSPKVS